LPPQVICGLTYIGNWMLQQNTVKIQGAIVMKVKTTPVASAGRNDKRGYLELSIRRYETVTVWCQVPCKKKT
jgi:hypothetical protein